MRKLVFLLLAVSALGQTTEIVSVNAGQKIVFTATADGTQPMTWTWSKNGVPIAGITGSSFTIDKVASSDAGTYRAKAANALGSVDSNQLQLSVTSPGSAPSRVIITITVAQ